MKKCRVACLLGLSLLLGGCGTQEKDSQAIIGKQKVEVKDGILTPEILWAMGRLGEVAVSPDNRHIAYSVRYYSVEENKGNTDLYLSDIDGRNVRQITRTAGSEYNLVWLDEHTVAYLANGKDGMQLYGLDLTKVMGMQAEGREIAPAWKKLKPVQLTRIEGGMEGFKLSPDKSRIAFIRQVQVLPAAQDLYADMDKSSGMVFNDLNYRHWDHWKTTISHVFISELSGGLDGKLRLCAASQPVDILENEPFECPLSPFGGIEQFDWSPDGQHLAFVTKESTGREYAFSTNSDVFLYDVANRVRHNVSEGNMGYDWNPVFSPDGRWLAWESMERDGYESDRIRIILLDMQNGNRIDASYDFDQFATNYVWSEDSKTLYFISVQHALTQIYALDVEQTAKYAVNAQKTSGAAGFLGGTPEAIRCLTAGVHDYHAVAVAGKDKLLGVRMSMSAPDEIYSIDLAQRDENGFCEQTQVSFINSDILEQLHIAEVEGRWMTTTDHKQMLTWVIYPPHFDPNKKYPALLYCQGGPQSTVSQFWSYRWNMQIMAANGYIVVAPNRRGLPGFGMEWLEQISGDYGGQNMRDYLTAIDEVSAEPYVDKDKLGCVGASYGGFSVYWLAGHHNKRFKAFIAHDGMFNFDQQCLETEEMWFDHWDLGGAYWDKDPKVKKAYAESPHLFVDKWDAPIFVIHGELDYRIVASQGMAAFNAAIMRGLPAELLIFPDENHWVLQPQNGVLWQRRFFRFLDKWVKGLSEEEMRDKHYAQQDFGLVSPFAEGGRSLNKGGSKEQNTETQVAQ